ncbi:MAG: hypothetical protein ACYC63_16055 [Armatimonadota bacterium]
MRCSLCLMVTTILALVLILGGCGGGDGDDTTPAYLVGTWMGVLYDSAGDPVFGGPFEVQADGTIDLSDDEPDAGTVSNNGHFTINTTMDTNTLEIEGTMGANDEGSGTARTMNGNVVVSTGTIQVFRANAPGAAGQWNLVLAGDVSGTFPVTVIAPGSIDEEVTVGQDSDMLRGVITGAGKLVALWGTENDNTPTVLLSGTGGNTQKSGEWSSSTGSGTWTATR